ncbi:hypothetical protein ACIQC9_02625 [Brevundimonas sp. NPDC092305]|uniref:hypothetical protein n=1 Tax=Brevundimonas sp. NPDC092305 TaxID=3363957 RepID=UPI0037F9EE68
MAHRARTADRRIAAKASAVARASSAELALNTLILGVSLVLLFGAVWTHAT